MAEENDPRNDGQTGEFDRLARRYLDLWQSQLSGMAADPSMTEQIARLFAAANAQVAAALQAAKPQGTPNGTPAPDDKTGTTAATPASGNGPDDMGELRQRVATLEARIAELEDQLRGGQLRNA